MSQPVDEVLEAGRAAIRGHAWREGPGPGAGGCWGEPMSQPVDEVLEAGRDAIRRHAWREAFDLLSAAGASAGFSPGDLENLGQAAWWTGRLGECISARERAYAAYVESANHPQAALVAIALAKDYYGRRDSSVGTAWLNRAGRLLEGVPECIEH